MSKEVIKDKGRAVVGRLNRHFRSSRKGIKAAGECTVCTTGYVSLKDTIESMFISGQNLMSSRDGQYDMEVDVDENGNYKFTEEQESFYDPTRAPGYDMADAFQDMVSVEERVSSRQSERDEIAQTIEDLSKKASESKNKSKDSKVDSD